MIALRNTKGDEHAEATEVSRRKYLAIGLATSSAREVLLASGLASEIPSTPFGKDDVGSHSKSDAFVLNALAVLDINEYRISGTAPGLIARASGLPSCGSRSSS